MNFKSRIEALVLHWVPLASAFFANQAKEDKKLLTVRKKSVSYGEHQAGITTPMQKNIYFVVLICIRQIGDHYPALQGLDGL